MKATKGNKVYSIDEAQKKRYLEAGYDICDDNGKVLDYGRGKTVPYETYAAVVRERDELARRIEEKASSQDVKDDTPAPRKAGKKEQ